MINTQDMVCSYVYMPVQNGKDSGYKWGKIPIDLLIKIVQACCVYPHGVIRLLGDI